MNADKNRLRLIIGLGNPGKKYRCTRHNAGFMVLDKLAEIYEISVQNKKFNTLFGRGKIEGVDVILAKPMLFMNNSGHPARMLAEYFNILSEDLVVIHDDIDLALERVKIKLKGGDGGHRGVKSLIKSFGGGSFSRLRIGIGRPEEIRAGVVNHVLGNFLEDENKILNDILARAAQAVASIMRDGISVAMNNFN